MNHSVMIDLETLDNKPTAAIASIGAVIFDPRSDYIGQGLHIHVKLDGQDSNGRTFGADTILWWLKQSDDARSALTRGQESALDMHDALTDLAIFISDDCEIWANGTSFDLPILAHAYRSHYLGIPWSYWQERDLRTLKGLNKGLRIERTGTHHNALDDAIYQARLVQHILNSNPDMDA